MSNFPPKQSIKKNFILGNGQNKIRVSSPDKSCDFSKKRIIFELRPDTDTEEGPRVTVTNERFKGQSNVFEFFMGLGPRRALTAQVLYYTVDEVDIEKIIVEASQ